jgi:hypothetical protein
MKAVQILLYTGLVLAPTVSASCANNGLVALLKDISVIAYPICETLILQAGVPSGTSTVFRTSTARSTVTYTNTTFVYVYTMNFPPPRLILIEPRVSLFPRLCRREASNCPYYSLRILSHRYPVHALALLELLDLILPLKLPSHAHPRLLPPRPRRSVFPR